MSQEKRNLTSEAEDEKIHPAYQNYGEPAVSKEEIDIAKKEAGVRGPTERVQMLVDQLKFAQKENDKKLREKIIEEGCKLKKELWRKIDVAVEKQNLTELTELMEQVKYLENFREIIFEGEIKEYNSFDISTGRPDDIITDGEFSLPGNRIFRYRVVDSYKYIVIRFGSHDLELEGYKVNLKLKLGDIEQEQNADLERKDGDQVGAEITFSHFKDGKISSDSEWLPAFEPISVTVSKK